MKSLLLLPAALLLSLCVLAPGAAAAPQRKTAIAHPTGPTAVVIRVRSGGGFVRPQANLRTLPSFTLYGDGSVIVPGAQIQIFPAPALAPLVRSRLGERQVQGLLRRARQAGLLAGGRIDYGGMGAVGVTDMPTTTVVINAGGRHLARSAYALQADVHGPITRAQRCARRALADFVAGLPAGHERELHTPEALAVYIAPFRGEPQTGAAPVVWPLARDLATAGRPLSSGLAYRCLVVRGAAARKLIARLRTADEQSQWIARPSASRTFEVVVRPLLPGQRGCTE
jgi:hypothetical protein